jgi:hypothetical protein
MPRLVCSLLTGRLRLCVGPVALPGLAYRQKVMTEVDGKQWEPVPGATVTAAEFTAARSLISQIHQQARWSPWVMQDRAGEYDAALQACAQWTSADAALTARTAEEYQAGLDQRLAEAGARLDTEQARAGRDRAERARHYDPEREQARLALLEQQAIVAGMIRQRDEILAGDLYPHADDDDRRQLRDHLDHAITAQTQEADGFAAAAGDPETVADARGWLPAERREMSLTLFQARRGTQVKEMRARAAAGQAALKSQKGMAGRAALRETLRKDKAQLAYWEDMPPLDAAAMCPECPSPAWHAPGATYSIDGFHVSGGPCPAWPQWAARVASARQAAQGPPGPPPPPLQPIAVLAPGLPIEDVITQLAALQASHPGAQIRPGRGHRWEIWPAPASHNHQATKPPPAPGQAAIQDTRPCRLWRGRRSREELCATHRTSNSGPRCRRTALSSRHADTYVTGCRRPALALPGTGNPLG